MRSLRGLRLGIFLFLALAITHTGLCVTSPVSRLFPSPGGGLSITGSVGTIYAIQSATALSAAPQWKCQLFVKLAGPSNLLSGLSSPTAGNKFYRAVTISASNTVFISGGSFTMGSPVTESERFSDEGPQTSVALTSGFFMATNLVTQAQYLGIVGTNPSAFTGNLSRPVEQVNWFDASNYCALLTARELTAGRIPAGCAYRVPTEAEWEYACRAGTSTRFYFGDDLTYTILPTRAWYFDNASSTQPVGQKPANPWGLFDMAGNVWEWCMDWYAGSYPGGAVVDPQGPASGTDRVLRGGSWLDDARFCRSSCRIGDNPVNATYSNYGFRVVLAPAP